MYKRLDKSTTIIAAQLIFQQEPWPMEHVHANSYNICMHAVEKKRDIKHTKGSNISSKGSGGS